MKFISHDWRFFQSRINFFFHQPRSGGREGGETGDKAELEVRPQPRADEGRHEHAQLADI